ncbi:MAG: tyrosine-type recombinase/integrase [Victivallales bacterium]|nr:tyrosine-type recombinase/integrase [Victivallales bacterium]
MAYRSHGRARGGQRERTEPPPRRRYIHCLRHTSGCELLRQTRNLRLVQKQMRHSSITTTTVYADVCDDEIQGAMDALT